MDFADTIRQFSKTVKKIKDTLQTEEATKMSLIIPFFQLLGYDVFNPNEFVPELVADFATKKGEKVDYAIFANGEPAILIEAKHCAEGLDNHGAQLFRYFSTTKAKFGILTNGLQYRFFTDLESVNLMDTTPFLELDLLNLRDSAIAEVKKFTKESYNAESIYSTASELKYTNEFKCILGSEAQTPSDEFIKFFLLNTYQGAKTQNVLERFRPIVKQAFNAYITETINDKIKTALEKEEKPDNKGETESLENSASFIETTPEEWEAYFIVKHLLKNHVPAEDILYKDTASYFNLLYKGNTRKWICRFDVSKNRKIMFLPTENKESKRIMLDDIYQMENYKDQLIEILQRYL